MKRLLRGAIIGLIVTALAGGIFWCAKKTVADRCVTVVPARELAEYTGSENSEEVMEGKVISSAVQSVDLDLSKTVKEVRVTEGETVKEGDILFVYDTQKQELNLKKEELARRKIEQAIKAESDAGKRAQLQLDLKEAELKVKKAQAAVEDGTVRATAAGVVTGAEDPAHPPRDGAAFIRIGDRNGLSVRGMASEQMVSRISKGDRITVTSWRDGAQYAAEVDNVSPYPEQDNEENNSCYPFTAHLITDSGTLEEGEEVDISFAAEVSSEEHFCLMKAFIRRDGDRKYVFRRGKNGKLEKRYIKVGRNTGDAYEVLSGISRDDWVAFPYGKETREGAGTREGTVDELLEM